MSLSKLLDGARGALPFATIRPVTPGGSCVLFFSLCDGLSRAEVFHIRAGTPEQAWAAGAKECLARGKRRRAPVKWLRVDWAAAAEPLTWGALTGRLEGIKRNYARHGVAFDPEFRHAFLEQELNANAMLYGGNHIDNALPNPKNFAVYAAKRFGKGFRPDLSPEAPVHAFSTEGVFIAADPRSAALPGGAGPLRLTAPDAPAAPWNAPATLGAGRRGHGDLTAAEVRALIDSSAGFLARQVQPDGMFVYGYFPCFGRRIPTYNALRHASSVYAMLEGWEITRSETLMAAIRRGLSYLAATLIRHENLPGGGTAAFVVDRGDEIKLGANAVSILALVKYIELTGDGGYLDLAAQLAAGIAHMQDPQTGGFVHVLHAADLSVKDAFRIVYYDGEAAFGLLRLYGLTREQRWLDIAARAFDHFIEREHWRAHDHWLSYSANELTRYRPEEKYFRFGVRNVAGHLGFMEGRETTYPTLLELCMAFERMLDRIARTPGAERVLEGFDTDRFRRVLHHRAHYCLNGFFWPEFAMYFSQPNTIAGSFFIRHHAFRVRIDDVEHYLSGYVAYLKMLERGGGGDGGGGGGAARAESGPDDPPRAEAPPAAPGSSSGGPVAIGMLRARGKPSTMARAAAHAAALQGARFYYFTPGDVDLATQTIDAWEYKGTEWRRVRTGFPDVIDNDEESRDSHEVWNALSAQAPMTTPRLGGKLEVMKRMKRAGLYDELQIPTDLITGFADMERAIARHDRAVIKPVRGAQGGDIVFLERAGAGYRANIDGQDCRLDTEAIRRFYNDRIRGKNYLIQKYVESRTRNGLPFDIRLHVRRNHLARWQTVRIYARIGAGGTIASNLSGGGSVAEARTFLRARFGAEGKRIRADLAALARDFPVDFQRLYDDRTIDALGIDIGIDGNGRPWLFEVNSYPGARYFTLDAAIPRVGYAIHLARQAREARTRRRAPDPAPDLAPQNGVEMLSPNTWLRSPETRPVGRAR